MLSIICLSTVSGQEAEKIISRAKLSQPHDYYVQQAEVWWNVLQKNKKNEMAWRNYFFANRYAEMTFTKCEDPKCLEMESWLEESPYLKKREDILALLKKNIPNTYTCYTQADYNFGDLSKKESALKALKAAERLQPNNPELYDLMVTYNEEYRNLDERKKYNRKWFQSNEFSPGLLNFAYNALLSTKPNSLLLTSIDNDTYPLWMLQDVKGIREDVSVLNLSMLRATHYRNARFKELGIPEIKDFPDDLSATTSIRLIIKHIMDNKPKTLKLYLTVQQWKNMRPYQNNLYLVGNLFEYSEVNIDNLALMKDNFENKYALDYLLNQLYYDPYQAMTDKLNIIYLPAILKLYKHYQFSGDKTKAEFYKKLGLSLGESSGEEWLQKAEAVFEKE